MIAKAEDLGIGEEQAAESLEILEGEGLALLSRVHGRDRRCIFTVRRSDSSFDECLNAYFDGFMVLRRDVGFKLLNSSEQQQNIDQVAGTLGAPVAAVRHIVRHFQERNFIHGIATVSGNVIVTGTRTQPRRWLEEDFG